MKLNLQTKITVTFILILITILMGIYIFFLPQVEENIRTQSSENLENIAENTAIFIEHLINDEKNKILVLSQNPILRSTNISIDQKKQELLTYKSQYQAFDEITLLDTEGNVLASTDYNFRGEWKTKEWYQQALQESVVSDAHLILNPWKLVMLFLSPITDSNEEVIGVVSGQINMNSYWDFLDNVTIGDTGFVSVINNDGKIIYNENQSRIFSKIKQSHPLYDKNFMESGSEIYIGECDKRYICAYVPLLSETIYNNTGSWHIFISQQESEILSYISSFKLNLLISTIIFSIILFFLGYFVSRSIVKPIQRLNTGMNIVSKGNLDYSILIKGNDELSDLTKSFNMMVARLKDLSLKVDERNKLVEKLLKQKDEFINQLGHDLKNPLGPLINLLPVLNKKEDDPKKKEIFTVLLRNVQYMKDLVTKTIKLARLNSPNSKLHLESISLKNVLKQILDNNRSLFEEKKIDVINTVSKDLLIYADKIQLEELFTNLLSNAVKFTNEHGSIKIDGHKKNDEIKISIKDSGLGMTSEQIQNLFTEFYKADSSRHDFESSGLGLSIAKRIAEKHGGRIWAESDGLGRGTTFFITLPHQKLAHGEKNHIQQESHYDIHDKIDALIIEQ